MKSFGYTLALVACSLSGAAAAQAASPSHTNDGRTVAPSSTQLTVQPDNPGPLGRGATSRAIINADQRTRVNDTKKFPFRTIAEVEVQLNGADRQCTGFMISRDTVITAGHCLYNPDAKVWAKTVKVTPGRDGDKTPFGSCGYRRLYVPDGWFQRGADGQDYGGIKLDCTIGNRTGWLGFFASPYLLEDRKAEISGYPTDKADTQWYSTGKIIADQSSRLFYKIDTSAGQDGAPILIDYARCGLCAAGVNAADADPTRSGLYAKNNSGPRITRAAYDDFVSWIRD